MGETKRCVVHYCAGYHCARAGTAFTRFNACLLLHSGCCVHGSLLLSRVCTCVCTHGCAYARAVRYMIGVFVECARAYARKQLCKRVCADAGAPLCACVGHGFISVYLCVENNIRKNP